MSWKEEMLKVVVALKDTEEMLVSLNKLMGSTVVEKAVGDVTGAIKKLGALTQEMAMKEQEYTGKSDDSKILDALEKRLVDRRSVLDKQAEGNGESHRSEIPTKPPLSRRSADAEVVPVEPAPEESSEPCDEEPVDPESADSEGAEEGTSVPANLASAERAAPDDLVAYREKVADSLSKKWGH